MELQLPIPFSEEVVTGGTTPKPWKYPEALISIGTDGEPLSGSP
jgi:hypothetical protein